MQEIQLVSKSRECLVGFHKNLQVGQMKFTIILSPIEKLTVTGRTKVTKTDLVALNGAIAVGG
jgi:hypothetical protein